MPRKPKCNAHLGNQKKSRDTKKQKEAPAPAQAEQAQAPIEQQAEHHEVLGDKDGQLTLEVICSHRIAIAYHYIFVDGSLPQRNGRVR